MSLPAVAGLEDRSDWRNEGVVVEAGPPKIAEMEDCAQRGCFRIADVTVTHSVTTNATGSTATVIALEARSCWKEGAVSCAILVANEEVLCVARVTVGRGSYHLFLTVA